MYVVVAYCDYDGVGSDDIYGPYRKIGPARKKMMELYEEELQLQKAQNDPDLRFTEKDMSCRIWYTGNMEYAHTSYVIKRLRR